MTAPERVPLHPNALLPCDTDTARRRHQALAEHCDVCGTEGRRTPRRATVAGGRDGVTGPKRVQMSRQRPWRADHPTAVRVDRSTRWGNPFTVAACGSAAAAVAAYREGLAAGTLPGMAGCLPVTVAAIRAGLAGRDVACWCPLADEDRPCHGDVILRVAAGGEP